MSRALRLQGAVFSAAALLATAAAVALPRPGPQEELAVIAALIVVLGVPHGGLDVIFAQRLHGMRRLRDWAMFGVLYATLAAGVVAVWLAAPTLFLAGFLLVSALHFSGDPGPGTHPLSRALYGGSVIVLPCLLHAGEVGVLFGLLAGDRAAALLTPWLAAAAPAWLAALGASAVLEARRSTCTALELAAVGALAAVAPPLVAFAVFFCGMHSARHILRTHAWATGTGPGLMLMSGLLPTMGVAAVAAACWAWMGDRPFDAQVIQLVFVGLAALTVPHMALVERVRLTGWRAPA